MVSAMAAKDAIEKAVTQSYINESTACAELIEHWVLFAYAGHLPPDGSFEKALALCRSLKVSNG
jgi:hypothetical protein